jgi:hypothetical protein
MGKGGRTYRSPGRHRDSIVTQIADDSATHRSGNGDLFKVSVIATMSARSLLRLATEQYHLDSVSLYQLASVRKGSVIKMLHPGAPAQSVLVVLLPGRLGLFSPAVLKGKSPAGGLESLEPESNTKLACLLSSDELSAGDTTERDPRGHTFMNFFGTPAVYDSGKSVIVLQHNSGIDFILSSNDPKFAERILTGVTGFFEV